MDEYENVEMKPSLPPKILKGPPPPPPSRGKDNHKHTNVSSDGNIQHDISNLDDIMAGMMQSVADIPDISSTSNSEQPAPGNAARLPIDPPGYDACLADMSQKRLDEIKNWLVTSTDGMNSSNSPPTSEVRSDTAVAEGRPRPQPRPRQSVKRKPQSAKNNILPENILLPTIPDTPTGESPKPIPRKRDAPGTTSHDALSEDKPSPQHQLPVQQVEEIEPPPSLPMKRRSRQTQSVKKPAPTNAITTSPDRCNSVPGQSTSLLYDNAKNIRSGVDGMLGMPLPRDASDEGNLTSLSKEDLDLLDPTSYMSLWELESAKAIAKQKDTPIVDDSDSSDDGTPLPMPTFDPPPLPPAEETQPSPIAPHIPEHPATSVHATNRTPQLPSKERDKNDDDHVFFTRAPIPLPGAGESKPDIPMRAKDQVTKLIPHRQAPPAPNNVSPKTGRPPSPVYAKIDKGHKRNISTGSKDDGDIYYLAQEISDEDGQRGIDNIACTSYDSEETTEEYSTDGESPPSTPGKIPVAQIKRAEHEVRSGYLYKQGGKSNNRGWRKRYVTFEGNKLKYFSSKKSHISKRIIPISTMKNVESDVKDGDSGRFRFKLSTKFGRLYLFAAETLEDYQLWSNTLMKALIQHCKANPSTELGGGTMRGGDMHTPEKEGYLRMDDNKRYMVIKDGRLCYYNSQDDYQFDTAIHEIAMETASVKDLGKGKLQLSTPYHQYSLLCEQEAEAGIWTIALRDSIASALADDNVLNEVYTNESNRACADCNAKDPHWAVLHLVVLVCSNCAGVHRQFWPFKVKSLRMDCRIWSPDLVHLYSTCGNHVANSVWEAELQDPGEKITHTSAEPKRKLYIIKKYQQKVFFKKMIQRMTEMAMNEALFTAVQNGDLVRTMHLLHSGSKISAKDLHGRSVMEMARMHQQVIQNEFLKHNGGEGELYSDIWAVMNKQLTSSSGETQIIKTGYLYKMHGSKKFSDYPKQYAILNQQTLKIFDEELEPEPKDKLPIKDILGLSVHSNDKGEPSFELLRSNGQVLVYGAGLWDEIYLWMKAIHELMVPKCAKSQSVDFTKAGYVHCKEGTLGAWKWCWFHLKNKELSVVDADENQSELVDLRKCLKMELISSEDMGVPAHEAGSCLALSLPTKAMYIQSDLKRETEAWLGVLEICSKESSQNLEDQQLNKENIPVLISTCLQFVFINGMDAEGIYRHSGTHSKVSNLLSDLMADARSVHIKLEDYTVHDVANVLKRYLRNLYDPVLKCSLYGRWLACANDPDHDKKLYGYKDLLNELPPVNYATLEKIIGHLCRVMDNQETNKMGAINLATVFGPGLLSGSANETSAQLKFKNTSLEIQVIVDVITYYQWLFNVDESELKREQEMQRKIKELSQSQPAAASKDFIHFIYINNKYNDPVSVKVQKTSTTQDVLDQLHQNRKIPKVNGYGLFEIVCGGDLERSLDKTEKVLDVTLSWSTWSPEQCKNNYLCVKEDYMETNMRQVFAPDITRFTELQFCDRDKKNWKKVYFGFSNRYLSVCKDRSDNKMYEWYADEIQMYVGVERKRKSPTTYNMTFLIRSEVIVGKPSSYFGRSICFTSDDEMYNWMGLIQSSQFIGTNSRPSSGLGPLPGFHNPQSNLFDKKNPLAAKARLTSVKVKEFFKK